MNTAYKYDILDDARDYDLLQDGEVMEEVKTLCALNLSDLMGTDHSVWVTRNPKFGFDIEIHKDEEFEVFQEKGIHPFAVESLAEFCRRFLNSYVNLLDKVLA